MVLQDLEKHRDVALEYITYFESTLLPSKTPDAPRGTRLARIEVIYCILYHIPSESSSHTIVQSCCTVFCWLCMTNRDALLLCANGPTMLPKRMSILPFTGVSCFATPVAPAGTHLVSFAVLQELWGYRHSSLQNYDRLKAWLQEGEHKLKFIKAHLACTLAALQGGQVGHTLHGHFTIVVFGCHNLSYDCLSRLVKASRFVLKLRPCIAHCDIRSFEHGTLQQRRNRYCFADCMLVVASA